MAPFATVASMQQECLRGKSARNSSSGFGILSYEGASRVMTESQQRDMNMRAVSEDQRLAHRTATGIGARLRRYHAGTEEELPVNLLELLEALERAERRQ